MHSSLRRTLILLCLASCGTLVSAATTSSPRQLVDGVVAVVGDEPILYSELEAYMLMRLNMAQAKPDSADFSKLRGQFLQELIDGKVLLVHARKDTTISVKPEEIDQALNQHIQRIMGENKMSQEEFETELAKQGLTMTKARSQWRRGIQEQLLKQKIQQTQMGSTEVSQKDVAGFYSQYKDSLPQIGESVRLRKLVVDVTPSDTARQAAWDKISKIRSRIDNGESFDSLAKQYSDDPSGESGGDLGFIGKGTLSEIIFEEKAFALKPGEVSEPFQTRMGFHIVKVDGRKDQMVHVRHILVRVAPTDLAISAVQARLDSIRATTTTDAGFIAAVRRFSTDRQSKSRDGDLGWAALAELPGDYSSAFDSIAPNAVSKVIKNGSSFMLLWVDARVASRPLTLEDDYPVLADKAKEIYAQKKLSDLVQKWRRTIYIDIRL